MRKVGDFLSQKREEAGKKIGVIAKELKIRSAYLRALEDNDYQVIPGGAAIVAGIVKKYSRYLGLDEEKMAAFFRRDFIGNNNKKVVLEEMNPANKNAFTPQKISLLGGAVLLVLIGIFYYSRSFWLKRRPSLIISQPEQGEEISGKTFTLQGSVRRADVVFVNDEPIYLDSDKNFIKEIPCRNGENSLIVEAQSPEGKQTSKSIKVYCQ